MARRLTALLLVIAFAAQAASAQQKASANPQDSPPDKAPSDAERVARLQRSIDETSTRLEALKSKIDSAADFDAANDAFKRLDTERDAKRRQLEQSDPPPESLQQEFADLEERWKLAKDRLDLALQERRALQQQATSLQEKLNQDQEALRRLLAAPAPASGPAAPPATTQPAAPAPETPAAAQPPRDAGGEGPAAVASPSASGAEAAPPTTPPPTSEALRKAQEEAQGKVAAAQEAEQEARSVERRFEKTQELIGTEQKLRETARKRVENARASERALSEQIQTKTAAGAPQSELRDLWTALNEARQRLRDAQKEANEHTDRLDDLHAELTRLQAERIAALQQAEQRRAAAEQAQRKVERIQSPLSPQNIWRWVVQSGPRALGIVLAMIVLLAAVRLIDRRIVGFLAGHGPQHSREERENRAKTLVAVFHNAANIAIVAGGGLMLLTEVGISIVPLMGGVAVVGLAVAFGAQNLIRDYFYGFMILLENQYTIGDVIRIGEHAGLVERVTLRVTMLRDLEGIAHFIPNGQIAAVQNLTHGWSRAVLDVAVAYREDVDRVMRVLAETARELRFDANFRHLILEEPEILGIDALAESAVVIKLIIKTRPLQQWTVKRAMLYRIKKKFDLLGIEIPFPHRTVYTRIEAPDGHEAPGGGGAAQTARPAPQAARPAPPV